MRVQAKTTKPSVTTAMPEDDPEVVAADQEDVAEEQLLGVERLLGALRLPEEDDSRGKTDREQDRHGDVGPQAAAPAHRADRHRRERP